jgi:hypothetical protein
MLTCKRMGGLVLASAMLLGGGILAGIVAQAAPFGTPSVLPALLSALAIFSVLFSVALLAVTFLVSLLPGAVSEKESLARTSQSVDQATGNCRRRSWIGRRIGERTRERRPLPSSAWTPATGSAP